MESDTGRKIPTEFENPIDNLILKLVILVNPYFKKIGMTPNILTSISGIFGLLAVFCIYKSNYLLAGLMYFISYVFDCFDGNFARMYDQVTNFGDYYDHVKDWVIIILIIIMVYYKRDIASNIKVISLIIIIIIGILCNIHVSCQEDFYHSNFSVINKSKTLDMLGSKFKHFCINNNIKYTRYAGCGTLTMSIVVLLIFFQFSKKRNT
jgi:phosphatidylglycerophosphate synthase